MERHGILKEDVVIGGGCEVPDVRMAHRNDRVIGAKDDAATHSKRRAGEAVALPKLVAILVERVDAGMLRHRVASKHEDSTVRIERRGAHVVGEIGGVRVGHLDLPDLLASSEVEGSHVVVAGGNNAAIKDGNAISEHAVVGLLVDLEGPHQRNAVVERIREAASRGLLVECKCQDLAREVGPHEVGRAHCGAGGCRAAVERHVLEKGKYLRVGTEVVASLRIVRLQHWPSRLDHNARLVARQLAIEAALHHARRLLLRAVLGRELLEVLPAPVVEREAVDESVVEEGRDGGELVARGSVPQLGAVAHVDLVEALNGKGHEDGAVRREHWHASESWVVVGLVQSRPPEQLPSVRDVEGHQLVVVGSRLLALHCVDDAVLVYNREDLPLAALGGFLAPRQGGGVQLGGIKGNIRSYAVSLQVAANHWPEGLGGECDRSTGRYREQKRD
mmetsp:Transcript_4230/g.14921  ORF Transcript_4230/g.14921 Transcript_4230/m.14921 type:complete len:447 (+) Transcript_4230:3103-4443(+)